MVALYNVKVLIHRGSTVLLTSPRSIPSISWCPAFFSSRIYPVLPSGGPILRSSCRWTSLLPLLAIFVGRTYHHAYSDGGPHKYRHCHPDHEELFPPPLSKSESVLQTFRIPWRQTGGIILIYCFLFDQSQRVGSGRIPPFRCDRQSYDALMTRLLPLGGKDADLGLAGSRFRTSRMW
jgi:hypothetical protein